MEHVTGMQCKSRAIFALRVLVAWWRTLGGGEWQQGELHIVAARDAQGRLVGIAPLFFTQNLQGEPALMLLGSIEISDYLDIIWLVHRQWSHSLSSFLTTWTAHRRPPGRCLDWYNLLEDLADPACAGAGRSASAAGRLHQEQLQPCPYIPLPGDWETYLAGIDKKQRHEIRRKMRRAGRKLSHRRAGTSSKTQPRWMPRSSLSSA